MKSKTTSQNATILSNRPVRRWFGFPYSQSHRKVKDKYFEIIIYAPEIAKYAQPGQFVNIKVNDSYEPLLRRPLSVHHVNGGRATFLYEVVGKGTEILSQRKEGEFLDVIGPLGKGFDYDGRRLPAGRQGRPDDGRRILVAGGMGTAPLVFLAEKLATKPQNHKATGRPPLALIGAKTKKDILCEDEFRQLGCEVKIATDDGSRGFKGYVCDLLKSILRTTNHEPRTMIYACGPAPMLKEISRVSVEHNIPAQISLEAHMACGIGACMGCVVKAKKETSNQKPVTRDGFEFRRVCKDGPVFEANQIIWD